MTIKIDAPSRPADSPPLVWWQEQVDEQGIHLQVFAMEASAVRCLFSRWFVPGNSPVHSMWAFWCAVRAGTVEGRN